MWTWVAGSNTTNNAGIYGNKGEASTEFMPGGREGAALWFDSVNQEIWIFGGSGSASSFSTGA